MRRRYPSETDNTITQIVVEEQEKDLYKDKATQPVQNIANKIFSNILNKSESLFSSSILTPILPVTEATSNSIQTKEKFEEDVVEPEVEFVMTARDRSSEFANTIRSLQGRNINRAVNIRDPKKVKQIQNYGDFMMVAKTVGKNIASTYAKLEKLTLCEFYIKPLSDVSSNLKFNFFI
jgi:hypothetical protein